MNLTDIDLNLLKVFEALYIDKNVTMAAKRLNIAQSSLSSSLKRLRALFQDELFIRSPKGMLPTKRAIATEPSITECLRAAREAIANPEEFDPSTSSRTFVIGGSDFSAFTLLPALITFLKEHAPHIRLEMRPFSPDESLDCLDSGAVDFAICAGIHFPKRFSCKKLFNEDMVIIARKNHPVIDQSGRLSLQEYASLQHIYITSKGEGERIIDRELRKQALHRDIYLRVQNFLIVPFIVENSDLIATVSQRIAYQCSQRSRISIVPFPMKVEKNIFNILWGKASNSDQECLWLINAIIDLVSATEKPHT